VPLPQNPQPRAGCDRAMTELGNGNPRDNS
jgi:hypothetical protein